MGRRDRERIERIREGKEIPFAQVRVGLPPKEISEEGKKKIHQVAAVLGVLGAPTKV